MDPVATILVAVAVTVVAFVIFTLGILVRASIRFGGHRVVSTDFYGGLPKRTAAPAMAAPLA